MKVVQYDLRAELDPGSLSRRRKAPVRPLFRPLAEVDRIVIHQWGSLVGVGPQASKRIAAGSSTLSRERARRCGQAPYHYGAGVAEEGDELVPFAVRVWSPGLYTWSSNNLNRRCVAVGIQGRFPRLASDWKHGRHTPREHLEAVGDAGLVALTQAAEAIRVPGGEPPLVLTHSQISGPPPAIKDRSSDPGESVIELVVAPLARWGLVRVEPDHAQDGGQPWPLEWRRHLDAPVAQVGP